MLLVFVLAGCLALRGETWAEQRAQAQAGARLERREASCCFEAAGKGSKRKTGARGSVARDAGLPRGANAITRELKDLWLDGDE